MYRFPLKGAYIITLSLCLMSSVWCASLPDIQVINESGEMISLNKALGEESILLLGYFHCRHLCNVTLKNLAEKLRSLKSPPPVAFLTVAIEEGPEDARALKKMTISPATRNWSFLSSDEVSVSRLARALDFSYERDPASGTYNHDSTLFLIKNGEVFKRFHSPDNITEKEIRTPSDHFFDYKQFCSEFDPKRSKYGPLIVKALSVLSGLFVLILAMSLLRLRARRM